MGLLVDEIRRKSQILHTFGCDNCCHTQKTKQCYWGSKIGSIQNNYVKPRWGAWIAKNHDETKQQRLILSYFCSEMNLNSVISFLVCSHFFNCRMTWCLTWGACRLCTVRTHSSQQNACYSQECYVFGQFGTGNIDFTEVSRTLFWCIDFRRPVHVLCQQLIEQSIRAVIDEISMGNVLHFIRSNAYFEILFTKRITLRSIEIKNICMTKRDSTRHRALSLTLTRARVRPTHYRSRSKWNHSTFN